MAGGRRTSMRKIDEAHEAVGSVDVPKSELDGVDEADEAYQAVMKARMSRDTPYSGDADAFEYEAVDHGDYYRVIVYGRGTTTAFEDARGRRHGGSFDRGGFEGHRVLERREHDVADVLAERLTVSDLRGVRREHGLSFRRGSTKREMIAQLIEQAPAVARDLAR